MNDTENYLNSILKKRLGSVVNYNGSSKTAVTRIPKQQQKVQHMPTVFRKKHQSQQQTGYMFKQQQNSRLLNKGSNGSYYSQQQLAQSQYLSNHGSINIKNSTNHQQQFDKQIRNQPTQQRVQYMLISKRIQSLKEQQQDEFQIRTKTVDVTNYNKKNVNNNDNDNIFSTSNNDSKKTTMIKRNSNQQQFQHQSRQSPLQSMQQEYCHSNTYTNNNDCTSNYRQQKNNTNYNDNDNNTATNVSKRKRIFNKNSDH